MNIAFHQPKRKGDVHEEVTNDFFEVFDSSYFIHYFFTLSGVVSQQRPPEEPNNQKQPQTPRPTRSTPLVTKRQHVPRSRCESLQLFVAFLLITLIVLNVILFFKLWTLEGKRGNDDDHFPDFSKLKLVYLF